MNPTDRPYRFFIKSTPPLDQYPSWSVVDRTGFLPPKVVSGAGRHGTSMEVARSEASQIARKRNICEAKGEHTFVWEMGAEEPIDGGCAICDATVEPEARN